jgi:hypothetical protein
MGDDDEQSAAYCAFCSRVAWVWLLASLCVDVALPSTIGAMCDARHCPPHGEFGIVSMLHKVWPHQRYVFGESSIDLWAAAAARLLSYALLALLRLKRTRRAVVGSTSVQHTAPLLASLNAQPAIAASTSTADGGDAAAGSGGTPCMSGKAATICAWAVTVVTWLHGSGKGLARLLQSGDASRGDGFGLSATPLAHDPSRHLCYLLAADGRLAHDPSRAHVWNSPPCLLSAVCCLLSGSLAR